MKSKLPIQFTNLKLMMGTAFLRNFGAQLNRGADKRTRICRSRV